MRIRPMTHADVPDVERVSTAAFDDLDLRTRPADWPPSEIDPSGRAARWTSRLHHLITHDAPGCWVGEDHDDRIVGEAVATNREGTWGLSSYCVLPNVQSRGLGRQLLDAALGHGDPQGPGIICSSRDFRAIRRYRLAGFDVHPAMLMWGRVDRAAIPALPHVRQGGPGDLELLDEIDRLVRGAGHGPDHAILAEQFPLKVVEHRSSRGYAFHREEGSPYLLAATDVETAEAVLWACLAESAGDSPVDFQNLTAQQKWAIDAGLAAGLELHGHGYLALRNLAPPTPYIPSGHFL